jgi:hypothetical protein
MRGHPVAIAACLCLTSAAVVFARDPAGDAPSRRDSGFVPERIDRSQLHGGTRAPAERERLYEQVERSVDRGKGRIEDQQAYDIRQSQLDRDERLGRIRPQRETERTKEEYDRERRIDAAKRRADIETKESASPSRNPPVRAKTEPVAEPFGSALTRVVAQDQRTLESLREGYQKDLRAAEVEREDAVRSASTAQDRASASRRFDDRRATLTAQYQAERRRILGAK